MKILYLSISYLPSRRASSVHVMKMCAALARGGHQVTLTAKGCRKREEPGVPATELHRFYGVDPSFEVRKLPRPAHRSGGLVHLLSTLRLLRRSRGTVDLVYSRDLAGAALAARCGLPVVFEAHGPPDGALSKRIWRDLTASPRLRRLVVISAALERILRDRNLLAPDAACTIAHDAADTPREASPDPPSPSLLEKAVLHVGYVGHLYSGRGVDLILRLAESQPACRFHLVGGAPDQLARLRSTGLPDNVRAHGFRPPAELPDWYARFGAVLMPYQRQVMVASGRADTATWMSPMKLFEYMAAGRAILSSDLPVLREVLGDGKNALLLPPDQVEAWDRALSRLAAEPELRRRLGAAARADHERHYTWDRRAQMVLDGL